MTRAHLPLLLSACVSPYAYEWDDEDPLVEDAIICGPHAQAVDRLCFCDTGYGWCPSYPEACCYVGDTVDVFVVDATLLPYKPAEGRKPWDWDGDVPDWIIRAANVLAEPLDTLAASYTSLPVGTYASRVLQLTDAHAPALLEGIVPPDPYVWVTDVADHEIWWTETRNNTISPFWNRGFSHTRRMADPLWFEVWDEDVAFDDYVGALLLTREDLDLLAGLGPVPFAGTGGLGEITIEVAPR